jgi:hypothetical protein
VSFFLDCLFLEDKADTFLPKMSVTKSPLRVIFQKSDNLNDTVSEDLEVANVVLTVKVPEYSLLQTYRQPTKRRGFFFKSVLQFFGLYARSVTNSGKFSFQICGEQAVRIYLTLEHIFTS